MIEPATSNDLLGTLGVNVKLFAAQLVNVSVVILVMWRWVYRPLVAVMEKRSKEIADGLKNAKDAKQKLADAADEREKTLRETKADAHAIIEETKKKADGVKQEKMEMAKREIEKLVEDAKGRIESERDVAFAALRNDVASLVAEATRKVAGKMDEKAQRALIAEAIKEVSN